MSVGKFWYTALFLSVKSFSPNDFSDMFIITGSSHIRLIMDTVAKLVISFKRGNIPAQYRKVKFILVTSVVIDVSNI